MAMKPLTKEQSKLLKKLYYEDKYFVGRDKLFDLVKDKPDHPTKKQVMNWLKEQQVYQLHLKQKKSKTIKPIIAKRPNSLYQMDIIDMGDDQYQRYRYILTLIDVFTRQGFARALKDKEAGTVLKGFKELLEELQEKGKSIKRIQSDNGSEFINEEFKKFLQDNHITQSFSLPGKPMSQGIVERFNGTLKDLIQKDLTSSGDPNWPSKLQIYLDNYNNTTHATLKMAPNKVEEDKLTALKNVTKRASNRTQGRITNDIQVNDKVRIKIFKGKLDKHSKQNWSDEIFEVRKVVKPRNEYSSTKYYLEGRTEPFSRNDIQKIVSIKKPPKKTKAIPEGEFEVDRIAEKKKVDGRMQYLVYWRGYEEPSWEPFEVIKDTRAYALFLKN